MAAGLIPKLIVTENGAFIHKIVRKPPFTGSWKLNYVYAYNQTSRKAFVGCVIRYENAAFKALFSGSAGQEARSTTDAALMALSTAVGFAASRGAEFLEIEGENKTTFSLVTYRIPPSDAVTQELLHRRLKELENLKRVEFRQVTPDTNEAANVLARMAMETEESLFLADNLLPEIAASLNADVNGRYVPWVHPHNL